MVLFLLTVIFSYIRRGHPCAHVFKVTNELTPDMIKVQHWKLYATHTTMMMMNPWELVWS
jgi:hypothetical protein